jgi:flavin reductase (DIM6/NTAB) family NADH-FMN oxidoreductase RutF
MAPFDASTGWSPAPAEPHRFKDVLANLASGVAIVSCWDGDTPRGLLVSSITGLSIDPPRFLFCVRKEAASHEAFLRAETCGVAILSSHDRDEAGRYGSSSRINERFAPARWSLTPGLPPTFLGGLSRAICTVDRSIDAETHSILIVTAQDIVLTPDTAPLVAFTGALHSLAPAASG